MQTNIFYKIKEFIINLFNKNKEDDTEVWQDLSKEVDISQKEENDELIAEGFTIAPKHFTKIYKNKRPTEE